MGTHRRPRRRRATVVSLTWMSFLIVSVLGVGLAAVSGLATGAGTSLADRRLDVAAKGKSAQSAAPPIVTAAPAPSQTGATGSSAFDGMPTVGALFQTSNGKITSHFCTGSVVDSPGHDLVLTAAHCIGGGSRSGDLGIVFVPGYHDGKAPYGTWAATRFTADDAWASSSDPDHDIGFLEVSDTGGDRKIQDVTGALRLTVGHPLNGSTRVVGYPAAADKPIICQNQVTEHSRRQMEFDCPGFTNGTSGGPFFAADGTVIGVIGGYQEGGNDPDVSYSPTFTTDLQNLYGTAAS